MTGFYKKATINLDEVDPPSDFDPDKLDKTRLRQYCERVRAHMTAPALVVWAKPDGRYGLIDGLNRWIVSLVFDCHKANAYVLCPDAPLTNEEVAQLRRELSQCRPVKDCWHRLKGWRPSAN